MLRSDRTPKRPRVPPKPRTVEQQQELNNNKKSSNGQDPVEVYCRIRPVDSLDTCVTLVNSTTLQIAPPATSVVSRSGMVREQHYRFKEVFGPDCDQKEVFDKVGKPLVADLLNGKNGLLFAYGVTGSGKTHTMQGGAKDGGIVRRSLDVIFNSINEWQAKRFVFRPDHLNGFEVQTEVDAKKEERQQASGRGASKANRIRRDNSNGSSNNSSERVPDTTVIGGLDEDNVYSVFVTYFEAYNNYIYDLLEDLPDSNMTKSLQSKMLREDGQHNMYVHACNEVEVKSPEEALEQLYLGQKRRKVAHTSLNAESSRSHSIFTIRIVQTPLDEQGAEVLTTAGLRVSQLSLVDLAGSERTSRTKATGLRIKEAGNINNTLMMLRTCIEVLRDNQLNNANRMVPYRDSKITHYLKNYFDGEGKVKMVICVNPLSSDYDETLPVMKFAELASEVQVQRSVVRGGQAPGLAPGRRRANLLFREVRRNMMSEGLAKAKDLEVDIRPIYTLSPTWPELSVSDETWLDTLAKLKVFLQRRIESRDAMVTEVKDKVLSCSERVGSLETENLVLRQQKSSLQALYDDRERKIRDYEATLLNAEAVNESLLHNYNNLVEDYNQALEERNLAQNQGQLEKQRLKAKLNTKLEMEREKQDRDFKNKLKEHKQKMVSTQLRALRQLADDGSSNSLPTTPVNDRLVAKTPRTVGHAPYAPSLAGPAVSNPRHRRSFSQGNVNIVIDHRPLKTLDTNTVYKPVLGKRRSVTRLRQGDLATDKKVTHYCLTTQGQDSQGELETKLYKGDVLPTTGGGAQVVFQDVEILKQRDPLSVATPSASGVKRGSDGTPLPGTCDAALLHERWRTLAGGAATPAPPTFNTPATPYKRTRL